MEPESERTEKLDYKKFLNEEFFRKNKNNLIKGLLGLFLVLFLFIFLFLSPPRNFPTKSVVTIERGLSLNEIIVVLEKENLINSPFWFKFFSYLSFNQNDLIAGDYYFSKPQNLLSVLLRVAGGDFGISPQAITIPEGTTTLEIGQILKHHFENFNQELFVRLATEREGYLFPDTYKFLPNVGVTEVIGTLEDNFQLKIKSLLSEIETSGRSLEEIVILASILEEEARTQESREIIAGILWKRIKIGMPLQVDAVFPYIIGKNTFELTLEDLKVDSPYNTYQNLGLPPGAISNPGLSSITAALRPKESPYIFYLSDKNGVMHYARDFEEHKRNKALYLR